MIFFTFNRPNIWPLQDIGLLKSNISNNYKKKYLPPILFTKNLYKKFTPYCSVATMVFCGDRIETTAIQY